MMLWRLRGIGYTTFYFLCVTNVSKNLFEGAFFLTNNLSSTYTKEECRYFLQKFKYSSQKISSLFPHLEAK